MESILRKKLPVWLVVMNPLKLDQYARNTTELILEAKELLDKGIGFISISDNIDFSSASGRLQFQILAAFAEFERSLISERTKEGPKTLVFSIQPPLLFCHTIIDKKRFDYLKSLIPSNDLYTSIKIFLTH